LFNGDNGIQAIISAFELNEHQYPVFYAITAIQQFGHVAIGKSPERVSVYHERRYGRGRKYLEKISAFHVVNQLNG
jgi:hypothetical protein